MAFRLLPITLGEAESLLCWFKHL